jgi:thiamine transport system substrate-binding protein
MLIFRMIMGLVLVTMQLTTEASASGSRQQLTVYTYDSFISKWGPGSKLKTEFERFCACNVQWVSASDSAGILARLAIEGRSSRADVVVGVDQQLTGSQDVDALFDDLGMSLEATNLPEANKRFAKFLPFDFGYLAFMFNTKAKTTSGKFYTKPDSMASLLSNPEFQKSVLIQDPRTSAPGLGLLFWMRSIYGEQTPKMLEALRQQTLSISRGWSEAYGFFTKGEAPIVLSYTTSEAYHREVEKTDQFVALPFKEGHYIAVETAAIPRNARNKELARRFLKFLLNDNSQASIASANWMYPVVPIAVGLPKAYAQIPKPQKILSLSQHDISQHRVKWMSEWTSAFAK